MKYLMRVLRCMVVAGGLLTAGCAAQGPLKVYDGPVRPAAEVAEVVAPEQVEVMSIDGREPPPGFLRSQVRFALLPGEHVLSLRYVELFNIGSEGHEVIRSRQAAVRFTAVAGGVYRLDYPRQSGRDAAREFAKAPRFRLVSEQGGTVESVAIKSQAEASLIDTLQKAFDSQGGQSRPVTNVDLLRDVWGRASPAERQEFRHWIEQQEK